MTRVTLLAPGLLGPPSLARGDDAALSQLLHDVRADALRVLLARARGADRRLAGDDRMQLLLNALDCPPAASGEYPLAAWSALGAGEAMTDRAYLRADPVHLRADMGKLLLFHAQALDLTLQEAAGLVDHVNAEMGELAPAPLELVSAHHWSMRLASP